MPDLVRRHLLAGVAAGLLTRPAFGQSPPHDIGERLSRTLHSGKLNGLHALLVSQRGKLVLEHYGSGSDEAWERRLGVIEVGARRAAAARCNAGWISQLKGKRTKGLRLLPRHKTRLLAHRRDEKIGIAWSGRPVTSLIEADIVYGRNADVTGFADADGRPNGVDLVFVDAVVADPGWQISRRYSGAAKGRRDKGWRLVLRHRLALRSGGVRENQERHTREQAQHKIPS